MILFQLQIDTFVAAAVVVVAVWPIIFSGFLLHIQNCRVCAVCAMQAMECGAICHCLFKMIFRKFRVGLIGLRWRIHDESDCEMIPYSVDRVQGGAIRGWT